MPAELHSARLAYQKHPILRAVGIKWRDHWRILLRSLRSHFCCSDQNQLPLKPRQWSSSQKAHVRKVSPRIDADHHPAKDTQGRCHIYHCLHPKFSWLGTSGSYNFYMRPSLWHWMQGAQKASDQGSTRSHQSQLPWQELTQLWVIPALTMGEGENSSGSEHPIDADNSHVPMTFLFRGTKRPALVVLIIFWGFGLLFHGWFSNGDIR